MSTWALFAILGLGTGAMYAALAIGVIIVYRSSGVVNFAVGAMAMFPAVVYAELRTSGVLILPVVGIPNRYDLGSAVATVPAMGLALLVGLAISAASYLLIFRPIRHAPALTLLVATVGLTIVLQGLAVKGFGTGTVRTPSILPQRTVSMFGSPVPTDRFWIVGVVTVIASILSVVYRRTRFGLATRAASANEKGATLLGYDAARLGLYNWLLSSLIAGTVGILTTSIGGVNPFNYSLYVVPALGAALAARLVSIPRALGVGIAIGSFEAVAVHIVSQRDIPRFFFGGFSSLVPFVVIVMALLLTGRTLPSRGTFIERAHVHAPLPQMHPLTWLVPTAYAAFLLSSSDPIIRLAAIETVLLFTLLLSIVVLTGYVGQVSLAQLGFAGFSALLLSRFDELVAFPWSPLLAIACTTALGTAIGVPALRIRGIQFAIVTFSAAVVFEQLLFRSPTFVGTGGVAIVDEPELFGVSLGILGSDEFPSKRFGYLLLATAVACALVVANIRRSALGRRFLAVRINERAAAAAGIPVARTKLQGAAIASFLAAVAGVMIGYKSVTFTGAGFEAETGLELFALGYLGGIGTISGAVIGGLLAPSGLVIVWLTGGGASTNQFLATGVALVIVATRYPGGLTELIAGLLSRWRRPERTSGGDADTAGSADTGLETILERSPPG